MSLKRYLLLMAISTIFCWLAWITVLFYINPESAGTTGLLCFYFSLFFALLGTISLLSVALRLVLKKDEAPFKQVGISLRQSLWFSILITMSLALLGEDLFTWWSIGILIAALLILEAFFLTRALDKKKYHETRAKQD